MNVSGTLKKKRKPLISISLIYLSSSKKKEKKTDKFLNDFLIINSVNFLYSAKWNIIDRSILETRRGHV